MEETQEIQIRIEEKEGVTSKNVYVGENFVFSLSENFPDENITEVFSLVDAFFGEGVHFGITRARQEIIQMWKSQDAPAGATQQAE